MKFTERLPSFIVLRKCTFYLGFKFLAHWYLLIIAPTLLLLLLLHCLQISNLGMISVVRMQATSPVYHVIQALMQIKVLYDVRHIYSSLFTCLISLLMGFFKYCKLSVSFVLWFSEAL